MSIADLGRLVARLHELGCERVLCKPLTENDNSKQQIYLGRSFSALNVLPYGAVSTFPGLVRPNFKADVKLQWIDVSNVAVAPHAQLILYPDYPEVRLSGFLRGCPLAPAIDMRPVPKENRRFNNEPDGRLLFLGIGPNQVVLAYLATAASLIAREFRKHADSGKYPILGVFYEVTRDGGTSARSKLLSRLREIHRAGWHASCRMYGDGSIRPYRARNGGGYTLEALFGVRPSGRAEPDCLGWELKAYSGDRVTLMTPEPSSGLYVTRGIEAFIRLYGRARQDNSLYFTGAHRVGKRCARTGLALVLRGFDALAKRIVDVDGGIELRTADDQVAAGWHFSGLIEHWGRKHALAAYIPFNSRGSGAVEYFYRTPALLGEGTEFSFFLESLCTGHIVFDPGSKLDMSQRAIRIKARSQFRISVRNLADLYRKFTEVDLAGSQ
jgi:hypothetical protein